MTIVQGPESRVQGPESSVQSPESVSIGIIGGSGLYDMAELTDRESRVIETELV